jgi:hypothetical protein
MHTILTKIENAKKDYKGSELRVFNPIPTHVMLGPSDYAHLLQAAGAPGGLSRIAGLTIIRVPSEMVGVGTLALLDYAPAGPETHASSARYQADERPSQPAPNRP